MGISGKEALIIGIVAVCLIGGVVAWDHFNGQGSQYLGEWVSDQYGSTATITKGQGGYYFQDNSGKYPATVKDDQLIINFGGVSSTAYIDKQTDKLNVLFLGMSQTYKRKGN